MSRIVLGKEVFTTLEEMVSPRHTALVVVDMQNDFCSPGGFFDRLPSSDMGMMGPCIEHLTGLLAAARQAKVMVIYIQHTNYSSGVFKSASDLARKVKGWDPDSPILCVDGTWGHQIADKLKPLPDEIIIQKHRHNSFMGTPLNMVLRNNGIKTVIVTGGATEVCVLATISGAIAHDYYVVVPEDCVVTVNMEMHNAALMVISGNLSKEEMTDSSQIITVWQDL